MDKAVDMMLKFVAVIFVLVIVQFVMIGHIYDQVDSLVETTDRKDCGKD